MKNFFFAFALLISHSIPAKVVVVTDACHAGKLAGSQIGGAQLTLG